ncbi:MAG: T6SS baseplate protein J-like component [Nitrospira sp.]|jgi:hypothetical protein|nr:MAG: T6SS baseplate protein J-like component [Nitrospira sp.]
MPLLLPNLDDRSWADLADEGRALIPVYGPEWTDHNASDPGITLVELLAWITEMDIFRLNQISDAERLRFLALVGVKPYPPLPASAVLSLALVKGGSPVTLPRSLEFSGQDANGIDVRYQTIGEITLVPGSLVALQSYGTAGFQDLTAAWRRRAALYPFGAEPVPDAALYLGMAEALPVGSPLTLYFTFGDGSSSLNDRRRILDEIETRDRRCRNMQPENPCRKPKAVQTVSVSAKQAIPLPAHHGVRTRWEYLAASGETPKWMPLHPSNNEVLDDTRAFTLDGPVTFRLPAAMALGKVGNASTELYYLRCLVEAGRFDAAPILTDVAYNGVRVVQQVPVFSSFVIDSTCAITYGPSGAPKPNDRSKLRLQFDALSRITTLDFRDGDKGYPEFTILDYQAPANHRDGSLTLDAALLGYGNGFPAQQVVLPGAPVEPSTLRLYTQEHHSWHAWELRDDFLASTRRDFHAVLDAMTGVLTFGDGEQGRVPPATDCVIVAAFDSTRAQDGNLSPTQINSLADSPHNRALLYDQTAVPDGWTQLKSKLGRITNQLAAAGGASAETLSQAAGRADQLVDSSGRAVTLADYERLAAETPGTRIARVTARANLHPDFPCFKAPGMITVIILPFLPTGRPVPTPGLIQAVASYLRPRRVIGTRVEVVGPTYLEVTVTATLQSKQGTDKAQLQADVLTALTTFLDPLVGGPDGKGWPFGRDVYRAEIMRILCEVSGVDHVVSLALIAGEGPAQCGNLCLGPTWLVASGAHRIQIL